MRYHFQSDLELDNVRYRRTGSLSDNEILELVQAVADDGDQEGDDAAEGGDGEKLGSSTPSADQPWTNESEVKEDTR